MPFDVKNERWRDGERRKKRAGKVKRRGMGRIEYEDFSRSGAQCENPFSSFCFWLSSTQQVATPGVTTTACFVTIVT